MAEVVAGAVMPVGLPGLVVQVVAGLAVKRLAVAPPAVLRDQQIRAEAEAGDRLAGLVARAL